jgi:hypothetical protein
MLSGDVSRARDIAYAGQVSIETAAPGRGEIGAFLSGP